MPSVPHRTDGVSLFRERAGSDRHLPRMLAEDEDRRRFAFPRTCGCRACLRKMETSASLFAHFVRSVARDTLVAKDEASGTFRYRRLQGVGGLNGGGGDSSRNRRPSPVTATRDRDQQEARYSALPRRATLIFPQASWKPALQSGTHPQHDARVCTDALHRLPRPRRTLYAACRAAVVPGGSYAMKNAS